MGAAYVSAGLRRLVFERADGLCEYCLIHEEDTFFGCEVDHVVSKKHDGSTDASNLALACLTCNRNKGSDIASLVPGTSTLARFFNPRLDLWSEHFRLDGATITSLTGVGEATVRIFGFNTSERLLERRALQAVGRYPPRAARRRISGAP